MNKNDLLQLLGCFFNENYTNPIFLFFEVISLDAILLSTIVVPCKYYRCCIVLSYKVFGVTFTCCQKD